MTGIAWAPKNLSVHVIEAGCDVKDAGTGDFLGSVTMTGFTTVKGQLFGVASVSGTCTLPGRKVLVAERSALVPVSIQGLSCASLDLLLGDVSIASTGTTVRTGGTTLALVPGSKGAEARFCAAAALAARHSVPEMLTPLSQLLFQ
jgi:hypothetical protein